MHMELNAALAHFDPDRGHLTIWSPTQVPYYLHRMLAQCLNLDASRIRVIKPFIGGGFGARAEALNFEIITALLARAAGAKVRMTQTREECFLSHRGRPQSQLHLKLGLTEDGSIKACDANAVQAGGAYPSYGIITILYAGAGLSNLYQLPAFRFKGHRYFTNTPACGPMRGHGTVASRFRIRDAARRDGRTPEIGSVPGAATELARRPLRDDYRRQDQFLWPRPVFGLGGESVGLVGAPGPAIWRSRARLGLLPHAQWRTPAHSPHWRTSCRCRVENSTSTAELRS